MPRPELLSSYLTPDRLTHTAVPAQYVRLQPAKRNVKQIPDDAQHNDALPHVGNRETLLSRQNLVSDATRRTDHLAENQRCDPHRKGRSDTGDNLRARRRK